jgi:hypothetical protein
LNLANQLIYQQSFFELRRGHFLHEAGIINFTIMTIENEDIDHNNSNRTASREMRVR